MLCVNMELRADTQPSESIDTSIDVSSVHLQVEAAKNTMLPRLDPDRIMTQCETLQALRKRSSAIRAAILGTIGAAGAGLLTYGVYQYFAPTDLSDARPGNISALTNEQVEALRNAEREAIKNYYDELAQRQTFFGHLKTAAWYGTELAIGSFICGLVFASLAQGQEQATRFLPMLFASYSKDFSMLYKKVTSNFSRFNEALYAFALQDQEGELSVNSDVLYGHFCAQLVVDYTVLLYSLESTLAFLFAHGADKNPDLLQKIRCGADIIDSLLSEFATELEQVINRTDRRSLSSVAGYLKNIYVYTTKFMCSCGEELYGDSFSPVQ